MGNIPNSRVSLDLYGADSESFRMRPRSYEFNTILVIEWIDIVSVASWQSPYEARNINPCLCKTVGFFLSQDEDCIRLSQNIQVDDTERDVTCIPWGCVKTVQTLATC